MNPGHWDDEKLKDMEEPAKKTEMELPLKWEESLDGVSWKPSQCLREEGVLVPVPVTVAIGQN